MHRTGTHNTWRTQQRKTSHKPSPSCPYLQLGGRLVGCRVQHPLAAALDERQLRPKMLRIGLHREG